MKTYEKYKNSGVSWLGKIPEHWEWVRQRNLCSFYKGKFMQGKKYPYLEAKYLRGQKEAEFREEGNFIKSDTKIILVDGENSGEVFTISESGYMGSTFRALNISPLIQPKYLEFFIFTKKTLYRDNKQGSAIPHLDKSLFFSMPVPVPPLSEQNAIAKFLDYKISRIEKLISIRQRQITELKELKKAVISKAVTNGDWKRVRLKRLFKVFSGATPKSDNPQYWDGNIIWITPADFQTQDKYIYDGAKNITSAGFKSCSTSLIPVVSIIFSKRAPVGKVAINKVALCTNQGCLSCVPLENISSEFFYYVMSICQEEFEKEAAGTTFKEISLTAFANFLLPAPPIAEQNEIAEYLDKKCAQIDKLINNYEKQITELNDLKARLISDAVTGKIDVR